MSNAIHNEIITLVQKELNSANGKVPQFNSAHEGYAVILEEVEETRDECNQMTFELEKLWERIKDNSNLVQLDIRTGALKEKCISTAEEAIQSAAMCQKFLDMLRRWNNESNT